MLSTTILVKASMRFPSNSNKAARRTLWKEVLAHDIHSCRSKQMEATPTHWVDEHGITLIVIAIESLFTRTSDFLTRLGRHKAKRTEFLISLGMIHSSRFSLVL